MSKNTPVYVAFLDFTKAFDKVNHAVLFEKLLKTDIPPIYINLIKHWYCNQKVKVDFKNKVPDQWDINNGVRQGGILSPYLSNIYIIDVINYISNDKIGCKLGVTSSI